MSLPKPNPGEKQKDFMSRCISNPTMVKEYTDQSQRIAICYTQWREK